MVVSLVCLLRRTHLEVWIAVSSENQKPRQHLYMGKKYKNLFPQIIDRDNLYLAYQKAAKGKRGTVGHLHFREHLAANISTLQQTLSEGTYRPGEPHKFLVYEPKRREIAALPFYDRVAQHALCNVIDPIFDRVFVPQSYACRPNTGTHAAARDVQAGLRRMHMTGATPWVLKTDFSAYFASIKRDVLHREFRRKISCPPTMRLIETMIPTSGRGISIGELLSQTSANIYGNIMDRWLLHTAGVKRFFRYMDDIVVLAHSRQALELLRMGMQWFSQARMGMEFSKWGIQPAIRGINFVGYRIWRTHKLLRTDSVVRAKRKIKRYTENGEHERLDRFLASWRGHAQHADSYNLMSHLGVKHA